LINNAELVMLSQT